MRASERKLLNRLVAETQEHFRPREKGQLRGVAVEFEFPTVSMPTGQAIGYDVLRRVFQELGDEGWDLHQDTGTGEVVEAVQSITGGRGRFGFDKDVIGTDLGLCTIETALTPEESIHKLQSHYERIKTILLPILDAANAKILGYGIQPLSLPTRELMANKGRYRFLVNDSANRFVDQRMGVDDHLSALTAATQCHLDIYRDEAIPAVNAMNGLAPLLCALTANSPVWRGKIDPEWLDVREILNDMALSTRIFQTGIPDLFRDYEDYVQRVLSFKPYMVKRGEEFIKVLERSSFGHFMACGKNNHGETVAGERIPIEALPQDVFFHAGFVWWTARLALMHGTLEIRPCAMQPDDAMLSVAALSLGLVENLAKATELHQRYKHHSWKNLRFDALRHGMRAEIEGVPIAPLVVEMLEIAKEGLQERELGEEVYLEPLFERAAKKETPAEKVRRIFTTDGIQGLLEATIIR